MIYLNNLEITLTDDNNFYVSRTVENDIRFRLKEKEASVTHEEMELLKKIERRKDACIKYNIHYFVLPDPSTSEGAYCHWCDLKEVEYAKTARTHKN